MELAIVIIVLTVGLMLEHGQRRARPLRVRSDDRR
jgi:hypothetical protein